MFKITDSKGKIIKYDLLEFSGGEIHVSLSTKEFINSSIDIEANLYSSKDILTLLILTDALRRYNVKIESVTIPYFPYARQDRVCNLGEALSVKVMADLINSQNYPKVIICDPHSDVTPALINNCEVVEQFEFVNLLNLNPKTTMLVSPDAGAIKKVMKSVKSTGCDVLFADKIRNTKTGKITGTVLHLKDSTFTKPNLVAEDKTNFLIIDDILDGGKTFIELAKELRKITTGKIELYVTHGIFSKGVLPFEGIIDKIYVANKWLCILTNEMSYIEQSVANKLVEVIG